MGVLRELYRRLLVARHRPAHWQLRPGTIDRRIFRCVVIDNEYQLPDRLHPGDVVLDIGAHTGSFALAVLRRGAGVVHCCEPEAGNFAVLGHNLAPYGDRVHLLRQAVWRSDRPTAEVGLHNPVDPRNTGAGRVTAEYTGQGVPAVAFDDLVADLTPGGQRLRLVKLDCEGAEWPVLLTSRRLGRIDALCGEYHLMPLGDAFAVPGCDRFGPDVLDDCLTRQGFRVRTIPLGDEPFPTGLFFADRGGGT